MTSEKLLDLIGKIDDKLIYAASNDKRRRKRRVTQRKCSVTQKKWFKPLVATVACAAVVGCFILLSMFTGVGLSAWDVYDLYDGGHYQGSGTSQYQEIYRPEDNPPKINPIPTDKYAPIYKVRSFSKKISKKELNSMVDDIAPRFFQSIGEDMSEYDRQEYPSNYKEEGWLHIRYDNGDNSDYLGISFEQEEKKVSSGVSYSTNRVSINRYDSPLALGGKTVEVDQRLSEQEILASLEGVRDELFYIFGRKFDSAKVDFYYGSRNKDYKLSELIVYYYDENSVNEVVDGVRTMGDFIRIIFDNYGHTQDAVLSNDILSYCLIDYWNYRIPIEKHYISQKAKLISLEKAEEHLSKGYVFAGHTCPFCTSQQNKVSFDNYDFVSFDYVESRYSKPGRVLPFYAFYKKIGVAANGNIKYARTYVCAIELDDIDEFFAKIYDKNWWYR